MMEGARLYLALILLLTSLLGLISAQGKCAITKNENNLQKCQNAGNTEEWGYVDVRTGVHMFYILYRSTHADGWQNRPWLLWLQGGPGGSGVGYGNFDIIGPRDKYLNPRETTFVQEVNVLFIDNPVGSGFSYVDDLSEGAGQLTETTDQVTADLYEVIKVVIQENPEFQTLPFYLFGQSYGGKMGAHFIKFLHQEQVAGNVNVNISGLAMGNSWISPIDSTTTWAGLLFYMNIIDEVGFGAIATKHEECRRAVEAGDQWKEATQLWRETEYILWDHANYVDFYNILKYNVFTSSSFSKTYQDKIDKGMAKMDERLYRMTLLPQAEPTLDEVLNGPIRAELEIIPSSVTWGGQSDDVFVAQEGDFMKPVIDEVEWLLMNTNIHVVVYQGQLDLICDTKAANDWVMKMTNWGGLQNYLDKRQVTLADPDTRMPETFVKSEGNFKFYKVLEAGHAVPKDQGWPALRMLQRILSDTDR